MDGQIITDLPKKTVDNIGLGDYLLGLDTAEGYQMLISDLAKKIVETYSGSSLGGSAQSLKSAIDGLNSNLTLRANSYIINGVTFTFRRFGRVVIVTSSGAATNAVVPNAYMGTASVADAYKPISAEIQYINATGAASIQFNLSTSCLLQVGYASAQIAAGANIRMATCYMASD